MFSFNLPRELWMLLFLGWLATAMMMFLLWMKQRREEDASIVDVGWAASIGVLTAYYAIFADGFILRRIIVATLAAVWSFRLAYHLMSDRIIGMEEDGRYQALRAHWGENANFYHFFFFQAQALLAAFLTLVFLVLMYDPYPEIRLLEYLGIGIWIISVVGESVADRQLAQFRRNNENKGKTCREGLWFYSRHPNYFFEWLHWVSYAVMGIGAPGGIITFMGPLVMYVFITKFTGIPYTEIQALKSRGKDYEEYQRTTSAFFPMPPKK